MALVAVCTCPVLSRWINRSAGRLRSATTEAGLQPPPRVGAEPSDQVEQQQVDAGQGPGAEGAVAVAEPPAAGWLSMSQSLRPHRPRRGAAIGGCARSAPVRVTAPSAVAGCSHSMPRGREARPSGSGTSQTSGRPGLLRTTRPETIRIGCATGGARFAVGEGVTLSLDTYGLGLRAPCAAPSPSSGMDAGIALWRRGVGITSMVSVQRLTARLASAL